MTGILFDFEERLEAVIDEWVAKGGDIREVMDALEAKLAALHDEFGADPVGAEP